MNQIKWTPRINDLCMLKDHSMKSNDPKYQITMIGHKAFGTKGLIKIYRIEETDLYKGLMSIYSDKILRNFIHSDYSLVDELYKVIEKRINEKIQGYDWRYEQKESYWISPDQLIPIGEAAQREINSLKGE